MKVTLESYTAIPEDLIERFAKVSHSGRQAITPEKRDEFIKSLITMGHESVLEPVTFTFFIEGISRVTTHQLVRHRVASYCQESGRYVSLSNRSYVIPETIKGKENLGRKVSNYLDYASKLYDEMVEMGIPKEDARYMLPQGVTTSIMVCMNARELRHFFKLRCDKHAQWEIRKVAEEMLKICYEKCPVVFEDLYSQYVIKNGIY